MDTEVLSSLWLQFVERVLGAAEQPSVSHGGGGNIQPNLA